MNTYEKVVEYLKSYQKLSYDIEFYETEMKGLKSISYSLEAKGTALNDMMTVYMQKIENAENKQKDIEKFIENNFDGLDRLIIQKRFINSMTFSAIGENMGYSTSHVKRMLDRAIHGYLARKF